MKKRKYLMNILKFSRHSADILSKELSSHDRILWDKRGEMDTIILIDEDTNALDKMNSLKPIWVLRGILTNVSSHLLVLYTLDLCRFANI